MLFILQNPSHQTHKQEAFCEPIFNKAVRKFDNFFSFSSRYRRTSTEFPPLKSPTIHFKNIITPFSLTTLENCTENVLRNTGVKPITGAHLGRHSRQFPQAWGVQKLWIRKRALKFQPCVYPPRVYEESLPSSQNKNQKLCSPN
ncbi:hypothetical protein CDAR_105541 [Caerostris darwini]|uniref:Ribosomal protein S4 n=1 Tax=Caerostris darwini TaxID=1538125 RepID=A0AAV4MXI5_9ARAC|nr:hypothetical protein CDAR_105541 [Caerostris darwini]